MHPLSCTETNQIDVTMQMCVHIDVHAHLSFVGGAVPLDVSVCVCEREGREGDVWRIRCVGKNVCLTC